MAAKKTSKKAPAKKTTTSTKSTKKAGRPRKSSVAVDLVPSVFSTHGIALAESPENTVDNKHLVAQVTVSISEFKVTHTVDGTALTVDRSYEVIEPFYVNTSDFYRMGNRDSNNVGISATDDVTQKQLSNQCRNVKVTQKIFDHYNERNTENDLRTFCIKAITFHHNDEPDAICM